MELRHTTRQDETKELKRKLRPSRHERESHKPLERAKAEDMPHSVKAYKKARQTKPSRYAKYEVT